MSGKEIFFDVSIYLSLCFTNEPATGTPRFVTVTLTGENRIFYSVDLPLNMPTKIQR